MENGSYCLFETPIGECGIAWTHNGRGKVAITAFQLPEATARLTETRIAERSGAARASEPPAKVAAIIRRISQHLQGNVQDFSDIDLDLNDSPEFARKVYLAACKIRAGHTRTYGDIAKSVGKPGAARAVGQALGRNPIALLVPCHRVLAANGNPGGFSAHGGCDTKFKLLALEGVAI